MNRGTLAWMLLYAITNRTLLDGGERPDEQRRREKLLDLAVGWASGGVDFIQVREKGLELTALISLTAELVRRVRGVPASRARILVNESGPAAYDIVAESGADGLHRPGHASGAVLKERGRTDLLLSVACHSVEDVRAAESHGADLALFAPVFEKLIAQESSLIAPGGQQITSLPGRGLDALAEACRVAQQCKVLALGGVTVGNAVACEEAGAAGVAGIRLFLSQEARSDWRAIPR